MTSFLEPAAAEQPFSRIDVGEIGVDLCTREHLLNVVTSRLRGDSALPLGIGSVNLDHLHQFRKDAATLLPPETSAVEWLMLADGMPIVRRANALTCTEWPRLTGSDLLPEILALAEREGRSVGFFGGTVEALGSLESAMREQYSNLNVTGYWSPTRSELSDDVRCREMAYEIADTRTDILVVGLGKPRQEMWIEKYGEYTKSSVLLAFGAAADFLAGTAERAPVWMRDNGLEWLHRLVSEPGRLSRRYLVEGPAAYIRLRSAAVAPQSSRALQFDGRYGRDSQTCPLT